MSADAPIRRRIRYAEHWGQLPPCQRAILTDTGKGTFVVINCNMNQHVRRFANLFRALGIPVDGIKRNYQRYAADLNKSSYVKCKTME
jgi:hypothetical protein